MRLHELSDVEEARSQQPRFGGHERAAGNLSNIPPEWLRIATHKKGGQNSDIVKLGTFQVNNLKGISKELNTIISSAYNHGINQNYPYPVKTKDVEKYVSGRGRTTVTQYYHATLKDPDTNEPIEVPAGEKENFKRLAAIYLEVAGNPWFLIETYKSYSDKNERYRCYLPGENLEDMVARKTEWRNHSYNTGSGRNKRSHSEIKLQTISELDVNQMSSLLPENEEITAFAILVDDWRKDTQMLRKDNRGGEFSSHDVAIPGSPDTKTIPTNRLDIAQKNNTASLYGGPGRGPKNDANSEPYRGPYDPEYSYLPEDSLDEASPPNIRAIAQQRYFKERIEKALGNTQANLRAAVDVIVKIADDGMAQAYRGEYKGIGNIDQELREIRNLVAKFDTVANTVSRLFAGAKSTNDYDKLTKYETPWDGQKDRRGNRVPIRKFNDSGSAYHAKKAIDDLSK